MEMPTGMHRARLRLGVSPGIASWPADSQPSDFNPAKSSAHGRCGMECGSKWQRIEDEYLIPVGFGWTVMIIALYVAFVLLP
jgi:hypothetical protein